MRGYIHEMESIARSSGGSTEQVLETIANRYIGANPQEPPVYRVHDGAGFRRLADCRYDMNLGERWPEIRDGQFVYAWGKLWCAQEGELPFAVSCYGPVKVFVNGSRQFASNLNDDVFPDRRAVFRARMSQGWNHLVLEFTATGTGCGAVFGTGSLKGAPLHFLSPGPARAGREGWIYSAPQDEPWTDAAAAELAAFEEERADRPGWFPRREWTAEELAAGSFARILGAEAAPGQTAFAWTGLRCGRAGGVKLHLAGSASGAFVLYLDGREFYRSPEKQEGAFRVPLELAYGRHQLVVRSICPAAKWDFRLEAPEAGCGIRLEKPYPVEGLPDVWLYLGPFAPEDAPAAEDVARMDSVFGPTGGKRFWRADLPEAAVRPYLEAALYGRWNYPLGVTLYGILKTGEELEKSHYVDYAADHIEQCTALHEYALWDTEQFGAPGINHQLALIDSLDDCGSFGAAMLTAHAARPLAGAREAAEHIAHYITHVQDRLPDGALYRVKGTTDFMMGTMWCDDLYMSTPFLGKYYALTGELSYLEDAARQFLLYKERMFIPGQQIMHHVFDHKFGKPNGVPWGRGNGWVLFSLTEILELMPADHALYQPLLAFFRELCQGYLRLQGPNGLWHQVLTDHSSYQEASCTSMFIYAFSRGIRFGWLEEPDVYAEAALRAWEALTELCIDKQGNVYGVCRGSGYSFNKYYYKDQLGWQLNDTHGIGIVLLAGIECLKLARSRGC